MDGCDSHHNASYDSHLQLPGITEQCASQTDSYLHVDTDYVPVHSALLTVQSPVFADMFNSAGGNQATAQRRHNKICIPMTSHTFADVCAAVKFLYQWTTSDLQNTPSRELRRDIDTTRPILQFAHKFNMKSVLKDCDICLAEKAQEAQGKKLFCHTDAVILWAALAEECKLTVLLSHAELFMARTLTPTSWLCEGSPTSQLSTACMSRVLRAAQLYTTASKEVLAVQVNSLMQKTLGCYCRQGGGIGAGSYISCTTCSCLSCSRTRATKLAPAQAEYTSVEILQGWQLQGV